MGLYVCVKWFSKLVNFLTIAKKQSVIIMIFNILIEALLPD